MKSIGKTIEESKYWSKKLLDTHINNFWHLVVPLLGKKPCSMTIGEYYNFCDNVWKKDQIGVKLPDFFVYIVSELCSMGLLVLKNIN